MSVCRYKEDTEGNWIKSAWSSPTLLSGTVRNAAAGVDGLSGSFRSFIFKNSSTIVDTPTTGSYNNETGEVVPLGWSSSPENKVPGEIVWMTQNVYLDLGGTWSNPKWAKPVRFSGEDGKTPELGTDYFDAKAGTYTSWVFTNAATMPDAPIGGTYDAEANQSETYPSGWNDDPITPTAGQYIWTSKRKYSHDGTNWIGTNWSTPSRFSGKDGYTPRHGTDYTDGTNGIFNSFVFFNALRVAPQIPSGGSYDGFNEVMPTDISSNTQWLDDPVNPEKGGLTWVAIARYIHNRKTNTWSKVGWSLPTVFIAPGEDSITVTLTSDHGYIFKNNIGVAKEITANVHIGGEESLNYEGYKYKWLSNNQPIYASDHGDGTGTYSGSVPAYQAYLADGNNQEGINLRSIEFTASDVEFGVSLNLNCIISNI